ncbi:MAG: hypothetical protein ACNA8P_03280 [Phycisphaerales bacterium]
MNTKVRNTILVASALLIVGSLVAFFATGMYPYTRFRDAEIEQANAESDLSDLFADTTESPVESPKVESVNAIGFLPSGPGLASISVMTLSGPAVVAIVGVLWWSRRKSKAGSAETNTANA